jgi:Flp pilus assembly protein TadD
MTKIAYSFALAAFLTGCAVPRLLSPHEQAQRYRKVEALLTQATLLMRKGSAEELNSAESALHLARELSPQNARVVDGLGCLALRRHDYANAKYQFNKALELDSSYDRPYAHLALIAEQSGRVEEARHLLSKALQLNPLNYRSRNNYAVLLADLAGDETEIREAYEEMLKAAHSGPPKEALLEHNTRVMRRMLGAYSGAGSQKQ